MNNKTKIGIISLIVLIVATATFGVFLILMEFKKTEWEKKNVTDVVWYDEDATEFIITTEEELYDLAVLSDYYSFEGQTVKLGADIIVNEGDANDWAKNKPEKRWFPIEQFSGTFDGQGHTISGLYGKSVEYPMGLFAATNPKATIRDFRLVNTYFEVSNNKVGSISASGGGTFEKIYTDAIVKSDASFCGGFIGQLNAGGKSSVLGFKTTISNCWFDGEVILETNAGNDGGGFIGEIANGKVIIEHCLSSGSVSCEIIDKGLQIGGFCGDITANNSDVVLDLKDSLSVTKIISDHDAYVGGVVGRTRTNSTVNVDDTYTTYESCKYAAIIANGGKINRAVIQLFENQITGYGGYQWTTLDFENYWAVDLDGTPILQSFTDEIPSLAGVEKNFNTDWYNKDASKVIINDAKDFLGMQYLFNGKGITFQGQIVELGADIKLNDGNATEWRKKAPEISWIPVGNWSQQFAGVFDGNGHTISGIYLKTSSSLVGLFGVTSVGSTIRNFKLVNSYYENYNGAAAAMGTVVGRCLGDVRDIYVDAIMVSNASTVGGFIGQTWNRDVTISNCWFDGSITMEGDYGYCAGGILATHDDYKTVIEHCLFTGTISIEDPKGTSKGYPHTGGLVGRTNAKTANLVIRDSLSAGKLINPNGRGLIGSVIGRVSKSLVQLENVFATKDCYPQEIIDRDKGAIVEGSVFAFDESLLIGNGGYQWTTLDFNNYWSIVSNDTPILKLFAKKSPSTVGLAKLIDLSWYQEKKDVYILDSKADLIGFQILASENTFAGKTIKLAKDIVLNEGDATTWRTNAPEYNWTAIGTVSKPFAGIFDGQGHSISGMYLKTNKGTAGMFGVVAQGSTVRNLKIVNSYYENTGVTGGNMGTVVGRCFGNVENIYTDAIMVSVGKNVGGIVAQTWNQDAKISNCWFDGKISMKGDYAYCAGGILAEHNEKKTVLEHCLFTGTLYIEDPKGTAKGFPHTGGLVGRTNMDTGVLVIRDSLSAGTLINPNGRDTIGSVIGRVAKSKVELEHVYATKECYPAMIVGRDKNATVSGTVLAVDEKLIKGNGGYKWTTLDFGNYWSIVSDDTPILKAFAGQSPSTEGLTKMVDFSWYQEEKDVYILDSKADLIGFQIIASENTFIGKTIKLAASITLNEGDASAWRTNAPEYNWTPVGTVEKPFAGIFDGNGYSISGMYLKTDKSAVGMFGAIAQGSTVRNLRIINSYYENTGITGGNMGTVVGRCFGNVKNVYSDAIMVSVGKNVGGIVAQTWDKNAKISNCWFDGSISMEGDYAYCAGGILAEHSDMTTTVEHCLFTGTIFIEDPKGTSKGFPHTGGLVGRTNAKTANLVIRDSLSAGELINPNGRDTIGSVVGRVASATLKLEDVYATKECYTKATVGKDAVGTVKGTVKQFTKAELVGTRGYTNTELDFDNYWVAIKNKTPELMMFTSEQGIDVSQIAVADTSWYTSEEPGKEYVIGTVNEFVGFQALAEEGKTFAGQTIKLGANIVFNQGDANTWRTVEPLNTWKPIGTWSKQFAGIFDGQGHSISGLYLLTSSSSVGLFGVTGDNSVIRNLKILNSYYENNSGDAANMGTVVGRCLGDVENVYTDAIMVSDGKNVGGIVAQTWDKNAKISNCWFAGSISMEGDYAYCAGGIVAEHSDATTTVEHCLFTGTISIEDPKGTSKGFPHTGGLVGRSNAKTALLIMNDSLSAGTLINPNGRDTIGSVIGRVASATAKLTNVYATTECYAVCTVGKDAVGVLEGSASQLAKAQLSGTKGYTNTLLDFDKYWIAIEGATPELKSFSKKTALDLSALSRADLSWYTSTEPGKIYVLDHVDEFWGFQKLAANGNTFAGQTIKLGVDVTLNTGNASEWRTKAPNNSWTSIGTWSKKFAGIFDGQGHTISGLYIKTASDLVGLFGVTEEGSVVRNFRIVNSYYENTNGNAAVMGAVVGRSLGNVEDIYSDVIMVSNASCVGGIVAQTWDKDVTISNCWFNGSIALEGNKGFSAGGILAAHDDKTTIVEHCLFTGTISVEDPKGTSQGFPHTAGLVGRTNAKTALLKICDSLSAGTLINPNGRDTIGSVMGRVVSATMELTNVYATKECYEPCVIGKDATGIVKGSAVVLEKAKLIGTKAKDNTTLDFTNYWVTVNGKTPELKMFSTK